MDNKQKIILLQKEIAHLIKNAPLNYAIDFSYLSGELITTIDSWEYKELMDLREGKHER